MRNEGFAECSMFELTDLYGLVRRKEVTDILLINIYFKAVPINPKLQYSVYKVNAGSRTVEQPFYSLSRVQKRLHFLLFKSLEVPNYVYTFKGHIQNAKRHVKGREVFTLDISGFFESTTSGRVHRFFRRDLQCSQVVSDYITDFCVYARHLPTGSPASPILGYWVYWNLWEEINALCRNYGCVFTLYMDDLTVSGKKIHPRLKRLIKKLLRQNGLKTKAGKESHRFGAENKLVTGIEILPDGTLLPSHKTYEKALELQRLLAVEESLHDQELEKLRLRIQGYNAYFRQVHEYNCF